jgi:hypothetical protein
MTAIGNSFLQRHALFASGLISKGTLGSGGLDEGFGGIILAGLLGAFCGLLFGLMLAHLVQYFSFLLGRQVNGHAFTIASTLLGAVAFACWTAWSDGAESGIEPMQGIAEN